MAPCFGVLGGTMEHRREQRAKHQWQEQCKHERAEPTYPQPEHKPPGSQKTKRIKSLQWMSPLPGRLLCSNAAIQWEKLPDMGKAGKEVVGFPIILLLPSVASLPGML